MCAYSAAYSSICYIILHLQFSALREQQDSESRWFTRFEIHNSSLLNKTHVFRVLFCRCLLGKPGLPCARSLRSQHDVDDDKIIVNLLNAAWIYTRIHRTACIVSVMPFCLHRELRAGVHVGFKSTSWQKKSGMLLFHQSLNELELGF